METIVFLPLTRTNWPVMVRLAEEIKNQKDGRFRPVMVLSNRLIKNLAAELTNGLECVETQDFPGPPIISSGMRANRISARIKQGLRAISRTFLLRSILYEVKAHLVEKQLQMARSLLTNMSPRAIVVSGDRNTGFEPALLRAARDLGIVSIIPPSAFSASVEGLFIARRKDPRHYVTQLLEFKRRFPNQWQHDIISGEDLSYFGTATTYAYERNGMLPDNPWVLGGGLSDWILVDSDDVKRRYISLGVSSDKIISTGHLDQDGLAASLSERAEIRSSLIKKYGLDPEKKILTLCLVNWAEMSMKSWEWHWKENEFLCQISTRLNCNVLLSLHPSQQKNQYSFLEVCYPPLKIVDERLAKVLPAVDIYVTGLSSSTVPWAVLSSVPTVIADYYPEKDQIHLGLPGVNYVAKAEDLEATIMRLINDENHFQDLRRDQQASGKTFGFPDGKAMDRIVKVLLTAKPRNLQKRNIHAS